MFLLAMLASLNRIVMHKLIAVLLILQIIGLDGKMVCHVTGNPRPEISWFKNGKPIFEGNRYKMKREGDNCILYLKDCSPDEDGYYKCVATNRDGKDETEAQFRAVEKL